MRTLKVYTVRCYRGIGCRGYRDITGTLPYLREFFGLDPPVTLVSGTHLENYPCGTGTKRDYGFGSGFEQTTQDRALELENKGVVLHTVLYAGRAVGQ